MPGASGAKPGTNDRHFLNALQSRLLTGETKTRYMDNYANKIEVDEFREALETNAPAYRVEL